MLNQVVVVGRIVNDLSIEENRCNLVLGAIRSYKNTKGEYETDFLDCELSKSLATNTVDYCRKGDLVGIKGHLEVKSNKMFISVEKITFLTSKAE